MKQWVNEYPELRGEIRGWQLRRMMTEEDKKRADEEWRKLVEMIFPPEKGE